MEPQFVLQAAPLPLVPLRWTWTSLARVTAFETGIQFSPALLSSVHEYRSLQREVRPRGKSLERVLLGIADLPAPGKTVVWRKQREFVWYECCVSA